MVKLFDTTLRDGSQAENISFTVQDKLRIASTLDKLGIEYIEAGWPGSNPKDIEFFSAMHKCSFKAKITSFGSTRRAKNTCDNDENIQAIIKSKCKVACIFGKSWDLHVSEALRIDKKINIEIIQDSVSYLKKNMSEVIYDAEHFFDGFKSDPEYALATLKAAEQAKADYIVLCDTNGGSMPWEIEEIFGYIQSQISTPLGIHTHNDSELAVANSLIAIRKGAKMVQGTINGIGERCGNSNLISVIATLKLKMQVNCVTDKQLKSLSSIGNLIREIANMNEWQNQPYIGKSAFAHKGGVHVSAILRNPRTYEHIQPDLVGNRTRVLASDLSGMSNIQYKINELGLNLEESDADIKKVVFELKKLENEGYAYEAADASLEILILKIKKKLKNYFQLKGYQVLDGRRSKDINSYTEATVMIEGPDKEIVHTASVGRGPVDALSKAVKKALCNFYPLLNDVNLIDYKVRILDGREASAAKTRVLITSSDGDSNWTTVGVDYDIIRASYISLIDSLIYKLYKEDK